MLLEPWNDAIAVKAVRTREFVQETPIGVERIFAHSADNLAVFGPHSPLLFQFSEAPREHVPQLAVHHHSSLQKLCHQGLQRLLTADVIPWIACKPTTRTQASYQATEQLS